MSDETREMFMEEMIIDWAFNIGGIWICTNGVEGHQGWDMGCSEALGNTEC